MYNEITSVCGHFFVSSWSCACFAYVLFIALFTDWEVVSMGLDCVWESLYVRTLPTVSVLPSSVLPRNLIFWDSVNLLSMRWCCFGERCTLLDDDITSWSLRTLAFTKGLVVVSPTRGLYPREPKPANSSEGFEMLGSFGYGNKTKERWYMAWSCKLSHIVFFWGFIFNKLINKICVSYHRLPTWFNI